MKLSPHQRHQIIFIVLEEAQRLAIKFGLIDGLDALLAFRDSTMLKSQGQLIERLEQDDTDVGTRGLLKKAFKANEKTLLQIISSLFAIKLSSKASVTELKHVIDLSEKELKKLPARVSGVLDSNELNEYVKNSIKDCIKIKFGVSRKDIREACALLDKKLNAKAEDASATISNCARLPLLLLKDKQPHNFNYHGIQINGLYKLIKILNGIENKEVARSLLHFFSVDSDENRQIIKAFFAAEKTGQYCRLPTMLIQTLSLLASHHEFYETLSDQFVVRIQAQSDKTSIESLLAVPDEAVITLFNDLFESSLSASQPFAHILSIARLDIAERAQRIIALNATQDVFLRSMFYFCFISPLLELVESKLKRQNIWQEQDIHKLRLELSTAFHVMLGMRSGVVRSNSIAKEPLLQELVTTTAIQMRVALTFTFAETAESSEQSELTFPITEKSKPAKHHRHRSRTTSQHSLFVVKPKSASPASSSMHAEEYSLVSNESPKRNAYSSSRTMSFYSPERTPGSSSSSAPSSRKRSKSGSSKKTEVQALNGIKVPLLALDKMNQDDDTLERYFNHLFACDAAITSQFVLSLLRPKDKAKFSWGVRVLNEASGKSNQQIAAVLMTQLSATELLMVFDELFQIETNDSWCRGNKLLSLLIQHYLANPDQEEYKKMIWDSVFSLSGFLKQIDLNMGEADTFSPEYFLSKQAEIKSIQDGFFTVLKSILSPACFPVFMYDLLRLGYKDLLRRDRLDISNDALLRQLIAFILIRFINPIIIQEAKLLTDPVLKTWYLTIIPSAIQSLASPIVTSVRSSDCIPTVRDLIFDPVSKDVSQRQVIYQMFSSEFHLDSIPVVSLTGKSQTTWDNDQCKQELNDLLKQEQFSGLSFKPNGTVTPRRDTPKPLISTLFEPVSPNSSLLVSPRLQPSSTPPALEYDADNEGSPSNVSPR